MSECLLFCLHLRASATIPTKQRPYAFWGLPALAFALHGWQRDRYDKSGPRYTSYPTALELHDSFTEQDYLQQIELSNQRGGPLSLYFHIPFCDTVCYYCACNKIITKNRDHAEPYLANLFKEIELQGRLFDNNRTVNQLHWGGGTPTFLDYPQMDRLMNATRQNFNLRGDDSGEYSIEIDPTRNR